MIAKQRFFLKLGLFILLALASVEVSCEVAYRVLKGTWYFKARRASAKGMIQVHPYFGACLVPNVSQERNGIRINHNSFRCRGPEFARPKPAGLVRVVALGGSSTYCAGVSDNETWEYFLSQQLGANHEVINMGAPGGTSIETMSQTALLFSDVQPDIALYYLGWNDAQVQHVQDLWPDWSDSHGQFTVSLARGSRDLEERTAAGTLSRSAKSRASKPSSFPKFSITISSHPTSLMAGSLSSGIGTLKKLWGHITKRWQRWRNKKGSRS